jgi:hypothetical protein
MFMSQYESIGQDIHELLEAWKAGKASLASGIDRNEKRLSSISSVMMSPTSTLSGHTIIEELGSSSDEREGGVDDALKKLTGESPSPKVIEPEVFEAISVPRPRSLLTREERIVRMKEDRKNKELARANAEAHRGMMQELQGVLDKKPSLSRVSF